ncbi:MAG: hypothetical protein ACKKL6_00085 [Candidatus Komeilibacteria bacterium]
MENSKHNIIVYLLLTGLIVSSVLGCVFFAQNMMMTDHHGDSIAKCCEGGILADIASHRPASILVNISLSIFLFALAITSIIKQNIFTDEGLYKTYIRVKERSGGFNYFNNYILLFSKGILHTKVY